MPRIKITKFQKATAQYRVLPSFMIIGTQKSGTSALAGFLDQHSLITIARGKETDFCKGANTPNTFDAGLTFFRGNSFCS